MNAAALPSPVRYDPAGGDALPFDGDLPTIVLLLVGEEDRTWAARTAIDLCDGWADDGRRVVLADFHFESPVLQEQLGGYGLEGVVDVFLYGASVARCIQSIPGHDLQYIPCGTYTPDSASVFRHPRWKTLVEGFEQSHATLAVFVPADVPELGTLAARAGQVFLLGTPRQPATAAHLIRAGTEIRGFLTPPETKPAPVEALPPLPEPVPLRVTEPPATIPDELELPPAPERPVIESRRGLVVAASVLIGALVLGLLGYLFGPGLTRQAATPEPAAVPGDTTVAAQAPRPLGEPLPFSVRVAAYTDFETARRRMVALQTRFPQLLFYLSPEVIQGVTYHKVMAGALPDVELARAARDSLLAGGALSPSDAQGDWSAIQEQRYTLHVGDYETRGAAEAAVDSLLADAIPAYPVGVPYSDGILHWYVYAGAFPDSASAEPLRATIAAAGRQPRLTPRFGSRASPEL